MPRAVKGDKRRYNSPRRAAAAAETREQILRAAKGRFEAYGWAGATVAAIAADANVSPKTIEALFATKAALLDAVVDFSIRGDADGVPVMRRDATRAVESAPDASTMLERHIEFLLPIERRSARIAFVVESAAGSDKHVAALWRRMTHNRRFGARWAARTLLQKPGTRPDLTLEEAEQIFVIAIDWSTYRTLTNELGLDSEHVRHWLRTYYRGMLLQRTPIDGALHVE